MCVFMGNLDQYSINTLLLCFVLFFMVFLGFLISLFTALAINYDAKARGIKNRTLFAVLGFFFPVVVAIVYLIVRKNSRKIQPKLCNHCGLTVDTSVNMCPQCGSFEFTDYLIQDNEKYRKRAKVYAITALIMCLINLTFSVVIQLSGFFYTANFARDKNNYSYDNDYEYSDDYDDDYDDYEDFFNQFKDNNQLNN